MGRDLGEHAGPDQRHRAEALDVRDQQQPQERNDEYHRKSALYTQGVQQQGQAVNQIGSIASETNARMVSTIRGGGA